MDFHQNNLIEQKKSDLENIFWIWKISIENLENFRKSELRFSKNLQIFDRKFFGSGKYFSDLKKFVRSEIFDENPYIFLQIDAEFHLT